MKSQNNFEFHEDLQTQKLFFHFLQQIFNHIRNQYEIIRTKSGPFPLIADYFHFSKIKLFNPTYVDNISVFQGL